MEVRVIRTSDEFESLSKPWERLLERSSYRNVFLTFEWLFTWWRCCGIRHKLRIVLVYDNGELVGIAPLMISKEYGFRRLSFISTGSADFEDFIIESDENGRSRVIELIFGTLLKDSDWDIFKLQGIREDSPNFPFFQLLSNNACDFKNCCFEMTAHQDGAFYIDTSGQVEDYFGTLRRRFLSDTRRLKARLFKLGNVNFCDGSLETERISTILEKHIELHVSRRRSVKTRSMFEDPSVRHFFKHVAIAFARNGWLDLAFIEVNNTFAATHLGYKYGGHFFSYTLGLDDQYLECGIGRLMFFYLIERCFKDNFRTFDFMLGGEKYKAFFNPKMKNLHFVTMYPKTVLGVAAYLLFQRCNMLYKKARGKKW